MIVNDIASVISGNIVYQLIEGHFQSRGKHSKLDLGAFVQDKKALHLKDRSHIFPFASTGVPLS